MIAFYLIEDNSERAFEAVIDRNSLGMFGRYASRVGSVNPERYFIAYRDQLVPFAAGDTGRRHYRTIISHLERMQTLDVTNHLDDLIAFLKDEHSNWPAFLDELETAGF